MHRPTREDGNAPGHDSFLDVVSNMVGILIILVMVAGLRVRNATVEAASSQGGLKAEIAALQKRQERARSMRRDAILAASQIKRIDQERTIRQFERDRLATAAAAWEAKIRLHRDDLDAEAQEAYDAGLELSGARAQLDSLRREREQAEAAQVPPTVIESYPTPLSKPVDADEAHFQLRGGRVVFIPLDELIDAFKQEGRQKAYKLLHQPELTDTVGPQGGFRLRYTLERHDIPMETVLETGKSGSYARLKRWTLIPVSGQLGESLDAALAQGSRFRQALSQFNPARTTVTLWTYPDSFEAFRRLKKELYHVGFATAGRPLPHGVPIGGSPEGTKSAAE